MTQPAHTTRGTKTVKQVRTIFALARQRGLNDDELHAVVAEVVGNRSISALGREDANRVIARLNRGQGATPRTVQHRRKQAGIVAVVQSAQIHLIAELASQRSWTGATLEKFIRRQCKHFPPRTTSDANKVIEGLKAMNRREGLWATN